MHTVSFLVRVESKRKQNCLQRGPYPEKYEILYTGWCLYVTPCTAQHSTLWHLKNVSSACGHVDCGGQVLPSVMCNFTSTVQYIPYIIWHHTFTVPFVSSNGQHPCFFYVICLVFRIPIRSDLQKICLQEPDPAAGNSKTLKIFLWSGSGIWIRIEIFAWIRIRKKKIK
jgi:hypothetical protein